MNERIKMKKLTLKSALWVIAFMFASSSANAEIQLRYSPADTTIAPGDQARISIVLDQTQDIRTIEVFVSYNPAVVRSVSGGPGNLFSSSGFLLFKGFEEIEPGQWHGYVVILGSGDYITGPGELFYWQVEGITPGVCPLTTVEVGLADGNGDILTDVSLDSTSINVDYPGSSTETLPMFQSDLQLWPNPFNPRVNVRFAVPGNGWTRLAVFDLRGNLVSVLFEGFPPELGEPLFLDSGWEGRNDHGQRQPGGIYLFRLETGETVSMAKGVLLK
ncbi:MAG: hypothetical protein KOO60_12290 [Gemmatimonadales bacterium]|nr:hypothetical protein [Gemmatimonadales bacterium]